MNSYALKFIMLGDSRVGKSQLTRSFNNKSFNADEQTTVGIEFSTKTMEFEKCIIRAQLWDTAGQERFGQGSMIRAYYRDAVGAAVVFDVTNRQTFLNVKQRWLQQLQEHGHEKMKIILVGNKIDLPQEGSRDRQVSVEEAIEFATSENLDYIETSALTGASVQTLFRRLIFSVAKLIPDVKNNLELTALPEGWVIKLPSEPGDDSRPRAVSDDAATTIESSTTVASYMTTKMSPSSLDSKISRIDRRRKSTLLRVSYVNYWTGDSQSQPPTLSAPAGLLFMAIPKKVVEEDHKENNNNNSNNSPEGKDLIEDSTTELSGNKSKSRPTSRQESGEERALTERSSSVKTIELVDPAKKPKIRKCRCMLL